ncbi:SAM-dependent methyltransferase [Chloroflexota bacterium]
MTGEEPFREQRDGIRKRLLKYTRRAFRMLPHLDKPRILDIGCGAGISTLELARLSRGEVTGIDIDQSALDKFTRGIEAAGLGGRVRARNRSMLEMDFPDGSFDIVWAEGSIYAVGFARGIREWKQLLKRDGYLVIHDAQGDISGKLGQIRSGGYELLGYFLLNKETWQQEYFAPLEKLVAEYRGKYPDDARILREIRLAQQELDTFKKDPENNSSVVFVMKCRQ